MGKERNALVRSLLGLRLVLALDVVVVVTESVHSHDGMVRRQVLASVTLEVLQRGLKSGCDSVRLERDETHLLERFVILCELLGDGGDDERVGEVFVLG